MICPKCQHENKPAAKFCTKCRTKLPRLCPQCGAESDAGDLFCGECGADLPATATAAPASITAPPQPPSLEAQFTALQQAMPASFREQVLTQTEGENRLVTVLFADMSSSLQTTAGMDPEEAAALVSSLLKAMVDVLLKYEGRIDRFLGDGLLAVFGTPQAHENDPERAILAAMEIREAARDLGLEVTGGINTGEVYVGGVGSERHQEVTVMGPAVHLASRLQGQAEPGQIIVGEATYRHTRRAFAFSPLSLQVKGISHSVTAYAVERALPRPEKARGIEGLRAELIGRDEEFARLRDAWSEVLRGRGQMVSLIGEAGVGKSRLVSELKAIASDQQAEPSRDREGVNAVPPLQQAGGSGRSGGGGPTLPSPTAWVPGRGSDVLWLEGRCLELGMSASYWLFVDLFRDYFGFAPEENERARGERLVASLRELVERGDLAEERLEEMGPLLGNLLSLRFGTDWDERLKNAGPEQIKHQTFLAIRDLFVALARHQPVILVCEDLHWADSLSLDVISLLMETLTLAPLLLLCIYRPERDHKCWRLGTIASQKCAERYTEIALRELTAQQSRRLVEALLTIENLPASVKELIQEKSRGNPFFVEEVVRSLIASGMVYQEGEVWRAKEEIESFAVPEGVQSVILSRVDRLDRRLRGVLESASVIGRLFRRRLLEYTIHGTTELERALWDLEDQSLIYQERVVPEEEYSFQHVLTQETVYQSILRRRRTGFHQQVAEAMEALYQEGLDEYADQLAYHYERSGVDEKAVEYLLKAGEKARRAYLNEQAISYYQRALARLERSASSEAHGERRLAALTGLGRTYGKIGELVEADRFLTQAIALGQELERSPDELAFLHYWLGDALYWHGQLGRMLEVGQQGLALVGKETQSAGAALMNQMIAAGYNELLGDQDKWREFALRNAQFIQRVPYFEELRAAYEEVAQVYVESERNPEEAMKWLQEFTQRAERAHDLSALAFSYLNEARVVLFNTGDLRGAIAKCQQALELIKKTGDKFGLWCWYILTQAFISLGDIKSAEQCAREGLTMAEAMKRTREIAGFHMRLGTIALCQGSHGTAIEAFRYAIQLFAIWANTERCGQRSIWDEYTWILGSGSRRWSNLSRSLPEEGRHSPAC